MPVLLDIVKKQNIDTTGGGIAKASQEVKLSGNYQKQMYKKQT